MSPFETKLNGSLYGLLRWSDWEVLRQRLLKEPSDPWFVYAVGAEVPDAALSPAGFRLMLAEIDATLRRDHREDHLGIVYADDLVRPTLVKIYDPNNLGSTCGSIGHRVPPGWVLSLYPPSAIATPAPLPGGRRRWWASLQGRLQRPPDHVRPRRQKM